jgi:hypothetical protein
MRGMGWVRMDDGGNRFERSPFMPGVIIVICGEGAVV